MGKKSDNLTTRKLTKEDIDYISLLSKADKDQVLSLIGQETTVAEATAKKVYVTKSIANLAIAEPSDLESGQGFIERIKEDLKKVFCGPDAKYDWCAKGSKDLKKIKDLLLLIFGSLGIAMPWTLILAVIAFLVTWLLDDLCGCKENIANE